MSNSVLDPGDVSTLKYLVTHVFCPLRLPDGDDHSIPNDRSLVAAIAAASRLYSDHASQGGISQWPSISQMLGNLEASIQPQSLGPAPNHFPAEQHESRR
ncbi:hypothetical protein JVU11DRAFT_10196 [Chiua virens]|nr:hypothetical protein JVU11DRAFT_10196 [Chiua virens]